MPAGSVTPFALINDTHQRVTVILDADMMRQERLNYHPLENTATTNIAREDLCGSSILRPPPARSGRSGGRAPAAAPCRSITATHYILRAEAGERDGFRFWQEH